MKKTSTFFRLILALLCITTSLTVMAQAPTITSFAPVSGYPGATVTITGTNLTGATAPGITFGGTPVTSITSNSGTILVVVIGSAATGTVSVTATGGTVVSSTTFTFLAAADGDYRSRATASWSGANTWQVRTAGSWANTRDRKSTRLNSSHG